MRRPLPNRHHLKQSTVLRGTFGRLSISLIVLAFYTIVFLFSSANDTGYGSRARSKIEVDELWNTVDSEGWRPSSAPRSEWRTPPAESNGYLRVRCNGGLNQQRTAICNAVLAARIMNATLVLPELDANSFWHDDSNIDIQNPEDDTIYSTFSGFRGLYDVEHFIETPKSDVRIVESIPEICKNGKVKKIKAFQLRPDRDASISWYQITALEKMKQHGAIYLTPFSHRLAEEIGNAEYQRLRCRVNYHALQFKPHIMKLSNSIVRKLREEGHFMSIHLRFEIDMLAIAGCFDIFTPKEQKILQKYRIEKFSEKELVPSQRRAIGKCPLTPEEVGLALRAIGFDNSTRIYLAAGELFGGERFMKPFRHFSLVWKITVLWTPPVSWLRILVDWQALLLTIWSAYFPTFSCQHTMAPSNFANNLLGHRLYYGFRTNIRPDRKALAPILIDREKGKKDGFEEAVRRAMIGTNFGGPNKRIHPESFYTNSWPECFCQMSPANPADKCPLDNVLDILDTRMTSEDSADMDPSSSSNSAMSVT